MLNLTEEKKEIRQLEYGDVSKNKLRSLQKYTVSLARHEYNKLKDINAINEIGENIGILISPEDYSQDTGVQIVDQLGIALFL